MNKLIVSCSQSSCLHNDGFGNCMKYCIEIEGAECKSFCPETNKKLEEMRKWHEKECIWK